MKLFHLLFVLFTTWHVLAVPDPTSQPSSEPSGQPTTGPSGQPSSSPHSRPTSQPTASPSGQPTTSPTGQPTSSPISRPTSQPSGSPTRQPSHRPSDQPTSSPTGQPSGSPTCQPSTSPSSRPSTQPSVSPTSQPVLHPTSKPTGQPSVHPSTMPSSQPSVSPTTLPSSQPTSQPSSQPVMKPTSRPSSQPSGSPTVMPSGQPSHQPSTRPTAQPSMQPSSQPVEHPTTVPSAQPSLQPTAQPSEQPSSQPSGQPVESPTAMPSAQPSVQPSSRPSVQPSTQPTGQPVEGPTSRPTTQPSVQPSMQPSAQPLAAPSSVPSGQPTMQPSTQPSAAPTCEPTAQPSSEPTSQPSSFPTDKPSLQPTMQPTSFPTVQPSSVPSTTPSSIPSMQPSTQPSGAPTGDPTGQPSGAPSAQPSVQPSSWPTSQPSNFPSDVPSTEPSSQPSAQPSAAPTGDPTAQPSVSPSAQPSFQPSRQPTAQPSSFPSDVPSTEPSSQPSAQPSGTPTGDPTAQPSVSPSAQPSFQPSRQPTAQPSSFPSDMPSTEPSSQPTSHPTVQPTSQPSMQPFGRPTSLPSSQPSSRPTGKPSVQPSSHPSGQPSSIPSSQPSSLPTAQPSGEPSSQPSRQPTGMPSGEPTSQPSCAPSGQPTLRPSSAPTTQPSSQPSCQPFSSPTSQPSSAPTTAVATRHYMCNSNSVCEGQSPTSCTYFTPSIVLMCVDTATPCYINTGTFSIGPNSLLLIDGGCELVLNATKTITVGTNSTIKGASINIMSHGDVSLYGRITTTGLGPLGGPGAPSLREAGRGGTYGGSGGNAACNLDYYSNINHQIGSINVGSDTSVTSPNYETTFGSGGGFPNAGRGGGRIILKTTGSLRIDTGAILDAMGTNANDTALGAGSGGSISIKAASVNQLGVISVVGGASLSSDPNAGAAGGGGRIMISITSGTIESLISTAIYYRGGSVALNTPNAPCLVGGSGTLYVQLRNSAGDSENGIVQVSNNDVDTFAATLLHILPSKTTGVWVIQGGVVSTNTTIVLRELSTCTPQTLGTPSCSAIRFDNSQLVTLRNSTLVRRPYTSTIGADEVRFIGSHVAGVRFTEYSVNIATKLFELTTNSSISYSAEFRVAAVYEAHMDGAVTQRPSSSSLTTGKDVYTPLSLMRVNVGGNLTIGNISASNMLVEARNVYLPANSVISKTADTVVASCVMNISQTNFACSDHEYTETLRYNNTYVFIGNETITVAENSLMEAAQILLCAPYINIAQGAYLSASFRGCTPNKGPGAGGMQSSTDVDSPNGGGGAGYGGSGGYGYSLHNSGHAYYSKQNISSGSGGGCLSCVDTAINSAGGGVINIVANVSLMMNGNLSANGGIGLDGSGGGSGGTIAVDVVTMTGLGRISAFGGAGGNGPYPGGGGGGGVVALFNTKNTLKDYNFKGYVDVNGGAAGVIPPTADPTFVPGADGTIQIATSSALRSSYQFDPWSPYGGPSQATAGQKGKTFLPTCEAGYGNDAVTGAICEPCPVGTYSLGDTSDPCTTCDNAPLHSHYIDNTWKTDQCPYACDSGYATEHCYNQIQNFVYNVMGVPAFAGMCVGIFLILILPLGYTRLKRRYGWFTYFDAKKQKRRDMFGIDFFARNSDDDDSIMMDTSGGKGEVAIKMQKFTTENPVHRSASADTNQAIRDSEISSSIRTLRNNLFAERRREHRMNDQDLVFHAYRVNLFGSNHPMRAKGGPWKFPTNRPACLRPMLRRTEFRALAAKINQLTEWHLFSFEMMAFYLVGIVAAPLAATLMKQFRRRRALALLKVIAHYDYSCFRCPKQRMTQNSLRIGISPDYTLAYVDFLFDEEHFRSRVKPLCPVGQVKLPATFKVAGLGTYCSPYFIDTNDLILQAVPQTDIPSSFINDAWIRFVVDLNTILRTVQGDSVHLGVYKLVKFLSDEQHVVNLGGLVVEFCTFSNNETPYASEVKRGYSEPIDERDTTVSQQFGDETPGGGTGAHARSPSETQANVDRFSLDSFGFATGGRKSNDGGNWFANFLDVSSPWGKSNGPLAGKNKGPMELEMRGSSFKGPPEKESTSSIITRESNLPASGQPAPASRTGGSGGSVLQRIYAYFAGIFHYISDQIAILMSSGYKPEDPAGKTLTFHEMCNAIQEGNLNMGIIVTHSKIAADNYIVQDDDYDSEDEDFYEEDVPRTPPKRLESLRESDEDSGSGASDESGEVSEAESISNLSAMRTVSNATDISVSLHKVYGDKADEMQKFYNIMMSADAQVQVQAMSTPEAVSNRKRASIPNVPTLTAAGGTTGVKGSAEQTGTKESPPQSQKSDRRTPESRVRSARSTPHSEQAGGSGRRSPTPSKELGGLKADNKSDKKAPSPSVFDTRAPVTKVSPASRGASPDLDDYDVDTSGYAYPGRQTYGDFDFSDALEMEPPVVQASSQDRRTPASEGFATPPAQSSSSRDNNNSGFRHSDDGAELDHQTPSPTTKPMPKPTSPVHEFGGFRHSEDSDAPVETVSKAAEATKPFRRSTGSSNADGYDEVLPAATSKPAPFRRSTGSSGSESEDAQPASAVESKPYTGFRYSEGSDTSVEAEPPAPASAEKTSVERGAEPSGQASRRPMSSSFRHSVDSAPSDVSSEPSGMPAQTFSTDDERPVPFKASPSKASPKVATKEEYTEFRPADRVARKTNASAADFEDAIRFSEFRHSNVYDDRVSDFGYDEGVVSVQHSIIRPRDSDFEEDGHDYEDRQPSTAPQSFNINRSKSSDSAAQEGSVLARGLRVQSVHTTRNPSTESKRSRIKSTSKRTTRVPKGPNTNRKAQKDLSRVNLAPSAHQQEFNAWRLVKDATVPVSGEPVTNQPLSSGLAKLTLGGGELHGSNPMHGRESMMVDRSSMITADERAGDTDLYMAEEGNLGALELSNPMRSAVRPRSVNPINVSDRSQIASWSKDKSRQFDQRSSDVDSDAPQMNPKDRPRSVDIGGFVFDNDSRNSEAITVQNDGGNQLSDQASKTIKQGFKAVYSSRVVLLFLSRYMFGGNVYPIGASYVRRILELIIFLLSIVDMVLGATICFEFYCVSADTTSCQDHTYLFLILAVFPFAIIITPLLGVTAVMLGPTATLTRIYAMWCRLAGVNNLIMLVVYVDYFSYFGNLVVSTYPLIVYTCSRAIQCLVVDQYIAHIEKLRYTRGWDGLNTSLFKTQDNKTYIN